MDWQGKAKKRQKYRFGAINFGAINLKRDGRVCPLSTVKFFHFSWKAVFLKNSDYDRNLESFGQFW